MSPAPELVTADLYARLDGLRTFTDRALADEFRDPRYALEQVAAVLAAYCGQAPSWCPGCPGRGPGMVCRACGSPVPTALRCRAGDMPEKVLAS